MQLDDDSACGGSTTASECGYFAAVHCTGGTSQALASCPATCAAARDCDEGSFCDRGTCMPKKFNGERCTKLGEASEECQGLYCGTNGVCCASPDGSCCKEASDCVDRQYAWENCHVPTCDGTRAVPACVNGSCTQSAVMPFPKACETISHWCFSEADTVRERLCPELCPCLGPGDNCGPENVCRGGFCVPQ